MHSGKIELIYSRVLDKLSRVTQSTHHIREIDGLRFLAIMPVIFLHLGTNYVRASAQFSGASLADDVFFKIVSLGGVGVNIFFSISGFVLALPFASHYLEGSKKVNLKQYYFKRLTRLEPPFLISMTLFFLAWIFINKYSITELVNSFWASLLYVHYFVFGKWSLVNPISWSLETEVQFYLIAPFLFTCFLIKKTVVRNLLIIAFSVLLAGMVFLTKHALIEYHLIKSIIVYLPFFATGILLCGVYLNNRIWLEARSFGIDLIGIMGICLLYAFHYVYVWYEVPVQCLGISMIFLAVFKGKLFNRFFTLSWITILGGMCYSLYLLHYGILYFMMFFTSDISVNHNFPLSYLLQGVIILPVVIVMSSIFFVLFEKPFMYKDWYKQFPKRYLSYILK